MEADGDEILVNEVPEVTERNGEGVQVGLINGIFPAVTVAPRKGKLKVVINGKLLCGME